MGTCYNIFLGVFILLFLYYLLKYKITFGLLLKNQIQSNEDKAIIEEKNRILNEAKTYLEDYQKVKHENKERTIYIDNVNKILIDNKYIVEKILSFVIKKNYKGTPEEYTNKYNNQALTVNNIDELLDFIENGGQVKTKKTKKSPQIFLDEILDKVKNLGYDSLNDEEKKFLNNFDNK